MEERGWSTKVALSKEAIEELQELGESMKEMNGQTIRNNATAVALESILGPVTQKKPTMLYGPVTADRVIGGDASNVAACSYVVMGMKKFFLQKTFNKEKEHLSSGHRELLTVLCTLGFSLLFQKKIVR